MKKDKQLILALDVLSGDRALELADGLAGYFDAIKIGYPLILAAGLGIIGKISKLAPVVADLKVADIPNTNRLISEQVLDSGAGGLIAHAFVGRDSLVACMEAVRDRDADLYVVTEMSHPGALDFMSPLAERMAALAVEVGASGVVAPATRPERIRSIRSVIGDRAIISPGVGVQGGSGKAALQAGADYLIVGRSVIEAQDPQAAASALLDSLSL